jgi:hypothetical protein
VLCGPAGAFPAQTGREPLTGTRLAAGVLADGAAASGFQLTWQCSLLRLRLRQLQHTPSVFSVLCSVAAPTLLPTPAAGTFMPPPACTSCCCCQLRV